MLVNSFRIKADPPTAVTDAGIEIDVRLLSEKAASPIVVRLDGKTTEAIWLEENDTIPSWVTPTGITTDVKLLALKARAPTDTTAEPPIDAGISTSLGQTGLAGLSASLS
jgi:hypothetical protein